MGRFYYARFQDWSPDGRYLLYSQGPDLWDISPDGQRFLFNIPPEAQPVAPLTVVTNWRARLKK
jgi:WD40-like Beta Propeller Repeat